MRFADISFAAWCARSLIAGASFLIVGASQSAAQDTYQYPSKVEIAWNRLYTYDEITKHVKDLAAAYPDLLKLESIGKSVQGRDLWLLTLNVARTGKDTDKPAMYIDGNIHGNEAQAAETVLYSVWYLTKSYGKVEQLTKLMDRSVFYFVPMVNPDGRAYWFDKPNTSSSSRGGQLPDDDDGDGKFDEDPPDDIDGDGQLLQMRYEDPNGRWRESPTDPRVLVTVEPDAKGQFKRYSRAMEGIDNDGDGQVNEDGPGGYDPNRNWPADWQPEYIQGGAHDFPLSLPESQAIATFILSRPNIAGVQAYHNTGGMLLRGPGAQYVDYPNADINVYDRIGRRGERMIPYYRYMIIWRDLYTVHGGFINWTYEDLGIISFTNELWIGRKYFSTSQPAGGEGAGGFGGGQSEQMEFNDLLLFGQSFIPWKKARHPVYGEVELGGWVKMSGRVPPAFMLEDECHRNFAFTVYHAEQMPLVEIANVEATRIDAGGTTPQWRIRADVYNRRLIPTTSAQGARRKYGPRDYIEISGAALEVHAGGTIDNRYTAPLNFVEHNPQKLWLDDGIAGEGYRTIQWIASGSGAATIRFVGPRSQTATATVELR